MTDRITVPASVIEDARAHPEKYRPEVVAGDRVLVVQRFDESAPRGLIGPVEATFNGISGPGVSVRATGAVGEWPVFVESALAWLRVGGVEQGPRPDVDGRVLVLDVHLPSAEVLVGQVGRVDFVGYDAIDRLGPLVVFPDPHGIEQRTRVTEWAILPEDDGMGEATAGRTVGSLTADDIGKWVEIEGQAGQISSVEHDRDYGTRVDLETDDPNQPESHWHQPSTQCRVSDGPGETT